MAQREKGNLPDARKEVRIIADAQRGGPLLHGGRDRALDVAFGRCLEHDYLQPEAARGDLRLLDDILRDARIGWIPAYPVRCHSCCRVGPITAVEIFVRGS